jgi:subtilisin
MLGRSSRLAFAAAAIVIAALMPATATAAPPSNLPHGPDGLAKVLITFGSPPGQGDVDAITALGGSVSDVFTIIPAVAASVPEAAIQGLEHNPRVEFIEPDAAVQLYTDPELANSWGVDRIGAGTAHTDPGGNLGASIKVAVIDSGIAYAHPDLDANYAGGWNFLTNTNDPLDDNGHGSHVSGIIAAEMANTAETVAAYNSNGVVGVAPSAQIYALKVVDQNGNGDYAEVISALQWAVDNGMNVVNISLGAHVDTQALHNAIIAAYNAGIVIVAAAGNVTTFQELLSGCPVAFPGAYPEVIAVTYTDTSDGLTGYSCTGPEVFLAAPGDNIVSTVPTGSCMFCAQFGYRAESGTSMASPHVAGVAALVLADGIADSNGNGRVNDEVAQQLCATATVADGGAADPAYPSHYGCGLVNAYNAVVGPAFGGTGAAPSGSFTSPAQGATVTSATGTNTFTWTEDAAGSGIRSRTLTQQLGNVVTPGTCAGVSWTTNWTASYTSPFSTGGYQSGKCYRYTLTLVNGAGGTATATSGNLLVDIPPPPSPSAAFTSPALGATIITTNTTNTVTWTESDGGGGGIASRTLTQERGAVVTPGTCDGVTWATRWSSGSYTSPFTTGGYQLGYCYRYTVSLTNGAGGTTSASSGNLLIGTAAPPPNPSATFTSPAPGATVTSSNTTNTITWTENDGGGGGITQRTLTQQSGAVVTAGTCDGVSFATNWSGSYTSPFTTTGYQVGRCYRYTLTLKNAAGGTGSASSGNLLIVAPPPPPTPSASFTSPATGATIVTTSTTNTVTWTESDGGGNGITQRTLVQQAGAIVTPGTCTGVSWATRWSSTSYTSPFTTGGYQVGSCYRYTLTVKNGAGGTFTTTSGNLLISPPPSPSATFTSPALGSTVISSSSTNTITWTESDGGGGAITTRTLTQQTGSVVTPGTCSGVTWTTKWSKTFTSPFTTGGYKAGTCYRYTLTLKNASGGTSTASSGNLLITK